MLADEREIKLIYKQAMRKYYDRFPSITTIDGTALHLIDDHKINKNIINGVKVTHLALLQKKYPDKEPILPCVFKHGPIYCSLFEEYVMPIQFKGQTVITGGDEDYYKIFYLSLHHLIQFFDILFSLGIDVLQPVGVYNDKENLDSRIQMMREWGINANKYNICK